MMSGETHNDRFKSLSGKEAVDAIDVGMRRIETLGQFTYRPPLDGVAKAVAKWQRETFGEPASRAGCSARLEHLRREVLEATEASERVDCIPDPGSIDCPIDANEADAMGDAVRDALASELADVFILLQSAADEAGMDLATIVYRKLVVNRGRTWKAADSAGVIEHVETEE